MCNLRATLCREQESRDLRAVRLSFAVLVVVAFSGEGYRAFFELQLWYRRLTAP
jgi:hypothetical protein